MSNVLENFDSESQYKLTMKEITNSRREMSSLIHLKPKKKLIQQDIAPNDYAEQPKRRIRVNLSDKELKPFEGISNWEEDLMA